MNFQLEDGDIGLRMRILSSISFLQIDYFKFFDCEDWVSELMETVIDSFRTWWSRIPELVFWHIPRIAYKQAGPGANIPIEAPCVGSINDEKIAPQETEGGIMNVLLTRKSVKAVLVGHNHGLDWCCPYHNLQLCCSRHTGYGGYGTWKRGARFVEIMQEPTLRIMTSVILEDGSVVSELQLVWHAALR